jgi:hypothetical protein
MKKSIPIFVFIFCFLSIIHCNKTPNCFSYSDDNILNIVNKIDHQILRFHDNDVFNEEMSIGTESGNENYTFYGRIKSRVDESSMIYILDSKDSRLLKYDKSGTFIWHVGQRGQGPADFQGPTDFALNKTLKEIYILDNRNSIKIYTFDGSFKKCLKLTSQFWDIDVLSGNRLLLNHSIFNQTGVSASVFSLEGVLQYRLIDDYTYGPSNLGPGGFGSDKAIRRFGERIFFSLPDKYEIREYNINGNLMRRITREINITPFNIKNEGGVVKQISLKDRSGPCFLWKDRFIINTLKLVSRNKERSWFLDFFDRNGCYKGSYKLPEYTKLEFVDTDGYLYFVQRFPYPKLMKCKLNVQLLDFK